MSAPTSDDTIVRNGDSASEAGRAVSAPTSDDTIAQEESSAHEAGRAVSVPTSDGVIAQEEDSAPEAEGTRAEEDGTVIRDATEGEDEGRP